ncbi:MAG: DUF222 domain-containing protein [Mycobacterium sp.]
MFESLLEIDPTADQATMLERIEELETLKAAAAAGQARWTAAFAASRRAQEAAAGMPAAKRGRGVAGEIALARRESPNRGGRYLGFAQALVYEMPHSLAALENGVLSEWRATLLVRESACLDVEDRRTLDAEMCADPTRLIGCGDARIAADAKAIAYRLDPHAIVDRARKAESERCVTIRPAPDTMSWVSALLPVAQGVSVYAALKRAADTTFDDRSRGQVMADTLVERVTGRSAAAAVPVAVNMTISDETLFGGNRPAIIDGYGPIPAGIARDLVKASVDDDRSRATLRKLYASPDTGTLVAMESKSRIFPKGLARFIGIRDQRCRTPYCDAPIRHTDHATPHVSGGRTSALNGDGLCEACNYAKQAVGWHVETGTDPTGAHTAEVTTPTGAHYQSTAPPQPRPAHLDISEVETRIAISIARHAA